MFLDMKSSTTIAEKLGHVQYYKLLDAYYCSFPDAIIDHEGEIYQYVGDEIVLTWKLLPNQKDNRSIDCFFAMKAALEQEREMFQERFGIIPSFKAGIHVGRVTTGQIGAIKKEIIFRGDVLNTAAWIQSLCNSYSLDLILSGEMIKHLELGEDQELGFLGEAVLRGKEEKKELFTVREKKAKKMMYSSMLMSNYLSKSDYSLNTTYFLLQVVSFFQVWTLSQFFNYSVLWDNIGACLVGY